MTTLRRADRFLALASFVGVLVPAVPAAADVISDEEAECREKTAGDRCRVRGAIGRCAPSSCTRNDYSDGVPPTQKQMECLMCEPGATKADTTEPTPAAGGTKAGCGGARIGDPSLAIGSSVLGIALLGLALRRRP